MPHNGLLILSDKTRFVSISRQSCTVSKKTSTGAFKVR